MRRVDRDTRMALLEAVTEDQASNNLILLEKLRGRLDTCVAGGGLGRQGCRA